jgi:hypothetical protein
LIAGVETPTYQIMLSMGRFSPGGAVETAPFQNSRGSWFPTLGTKTRTSPRIGAPGKPMNNKVIAYAQMAARKTEQLNGLHIASELWQRR